LSPSDPQALLTRSEPPTTDRLFPTLTEAPINGITPPPYLLETSRPGMFAVGDVRGGNINRVASAVGEGSIAIAFVHQVLHH
jgi:thioredoxin reductase